MTSIYSMISLVVLLLATYSYSAPVGIELQNSTIVTSVENATVAVEEKHKRGGFFADFSSSDEYIPGMNAGRKVKYHVFRHVDTDLPHQNTGLGHADTVFRQTRDPVEDETTVVDETTTIVESNTDNSQKREIETETEEPEKREVETETETAESEKHKTETETEEPEKREVETETEESEKREIETETAESEKRETETEEPEKRETETEESEKRETETETETETEESHKRETETEEPEKRETETEESEKREAETETEESEKREIEDETSTFDFTTVEPTGQTEIKHSERKLQPDSFETASEFNKRAIGSIQSVEPVESSTSEDVEQETSTIESSSSSSSTVEFAKTTGLIGDEKSSTSEYETTVEPVEETTTVSNVEMQNTTKIVAVIPGRIAQTKIVINSDKQIPVVVEQKQLSQGQN